MRTTVLFLRRLYLVLQLCHPVAVRGHPEDPAALGLGVGRQVGAVRRLRRRRAQTRKLVQSGLSSSIFAIFWFE